MHTILDMLTLVATAAVIYQLRVKLVDTYQDDQDSVKTYYVVRAFIFSKEMLQSLCRAFTPCTIDYPVSPVRAEITLLVLLALQVIPCVALAAVAHPGTNHPLAFRVCLVALCAMIALSSACQA